MRDWSLHGSIRRVLLAHASYPDLHERTTEGEGSLLKSDEVQDGLSQGAHEDEAPPVRCKDVTSIGAIDSPYHASSRPGTGRAIATQLRSDLSLRLLHALSSSAHKGVVLGLVTPPRSTHNSFLDPAEPTSARLSHQRSAAAHCSFSFSVDRCSR